MGRRVRPASWALIAIVVGLGGSATALADALSPNAAPGLHIWLDAADGASIFVDEAGTQVAEEGQSVAVWKDKSGQGNHSTQAFEEFQPVRGEDRGRHAVLFQRSAMHLDALGEVVNGEGFTLFLALRPELRKQKIFGIAGGGKANTEGPNVARYLQTHRDGGKGPRRHAEKADEQQFMLQYTHDKWEKLYSTHTVTGDWVIWELVAGDGEVSLMADAVPAGTTTADARFQPYAAAVLGADFNKKAEGREFFSGAFGELLGFKGTLDEETRAGLRAYLVEKWQPGE